MNFSPYNSHGENILPRKILIKCGNFFFLEGIKLGLEVLAQLTNAEIARPDVVTWVRTWDLTIVCEFNFSGSPLHLRPKKIKMWQLVFVSTNKVVQQQLMFMISLVTP